MPEIVLRLNILFHYHMIQPTCWWRGCLHARTLISSFSPFFFEQARDAKLLAETMAIFQEVGSPRARKREREVIDWDRDEEERERGGGRGLVGMGPTNSEFTRLQESKGASDLSALLN